MTFMATTDFPYTAHWSLASEGTGIITDIADINQSLNNIFTTEEGSDPTRPDFCGGWQTYIDYPSDELPIHLVREYTLAVRKWEPRVILESITNVVKGVGHHVVCTIQYRIRPEIAGQFKNKSMTLELTNG